MKLKTSRSGAPPGDRICSASGDAAPERSKQRAALTAQVRGRENEDRVRVTERRNRGSLAELAGGTALLSDGNLPFNSR